jgi:hypothetical protein
MLPASVKCAVYVSRCNVGFPHKPSAPVQSFNLMRGSRGLICRPCSMPRSHPRVDAVAKITLASPVLMASSNEIDGHLESRQRAATWSGDSSGTSSRRPSNCISGGHAHERRPSGDQTYEGRSVTSVGGRMIDRPVVQRARRILGQRRPECNRRSRVASINHDLGALAPRQGVEASDRAWLPQRRLGAAAGHVRG